MTEVHIAICKLIYAYFTTEIILKQLFTSVSVIIGEYSPRLRLGEYSIRTDMFGQDWAKQKLN